MNVQIYKIDMELTVLKSLHHAKRILEATRKQNVTLSFDTSDTSQAYFRPIKDTTEYSVWEPDTSLSIPVEFQPSMRIEETEAVRELYRLRKYYNRKWLD